MYEQKCETKIQYKIINKQNKKKNSTTNVPEKYEINVKIRSAKNI